MREKIVVTKKNESTMYLDCDQGILYELKDHFTFEVPGAKFSPKYKAKVWDGTISLLDMRFGTLPVGLYSELKRYALGLDYDVESADSRYGLPDDETHVTYDDIVSFVQSLNLSSNESKIEPRDFQLQSIFNCIKYQKQISITPTGGGKSLILYCIYRWYASKGKSTMLVVPNLSLIKQMQSDFIDYSSHNHYDVLQNLHVISEGAEKTLNTSLTLATWQSIQKQSSNWLNLVDCIIMDECHSAKSDVVKGIFEKATEVKYKIGVTGSLDKSATNQMVLRGVIGEISQVKTTRDLIDDGHLSDVKISCIILKYNKASKKLIKDVDYQTELDFLNSHELRNKFIRKLALMQKGVCLVLFNRVESHGIPLYEEIKKFATTQKVHLVHGDVEAESREEIRNFVQSSSEDHIIVASTGTMSTGVNLPSISSIIFASPTKSVIKVMQSIGRGLRKSHNKTELKLYDIADSIVPSKYKPNYVMTHFIERLRIYNAEKHNYKITEVQLEHD